MHSYAGLGYISEITAAGNDGFFSYLVRICGGENAYQGALSFPTLSREAIFKLNPDVIIDLVRSEEEAAEARKGWLSLSSVNAVRNGRLYMFTDESDTVPGPRAYLTIRKTSLALHPEGEGGADEGNESRKDNEADVADATEAPEAPALNITAPSGTAPTAPIAPAAPAAPTTPADPSTPSTPADPGTPITPKAPNAPGEGPGAPGGEG